MALDVKGALDGGVRGEKFLRQARTLDRCILRSRMRLRTSTSPSPGVGVSVSTKLKLLSWIAPCGRRASNDWRFFMSLLPLQMERSVYHVLAAGAGAPPT